MTGIRQRVSDRWAIDIRPVRGMIAGGIAFSVGRAILSWGAPWPLKIIIDNVLSHHKLPRFLRFLPNNAIHRLDVLALSMVVLAVLLGVFSYGANGLLANAGQRVVYELRSKLFRHIENQSLSFHFKNPVGDLLARLGGDVQAMQGVVVNVLPVIVENVLTIVGMIVIMFVLDWRYSLITLSLVPALYLMVRHYLTAIKSAQREARTNEGQASTAAQQVLISLPVVQAFGAEDREASNYGSLAMKGLEASRRSVLLESRFTPMVTATMTISTAITVLFGARAVMSGRLTIGDLIVFMAYLRGVYTPVRQLAKVAAMIGRGQASADRVLHILNTKEHIPEIAYPRPLHQVTGALEFESASYSYAGGPAPVLQDVSVTVEPGTRHALVGATGSGKSTLLRLVPRFIDADKGRVLLDGVDVKDLALRDLRSHIALVPQESSLLGGTVWENIAYGVRDLSRTDAIAAARSAGVHEVFAALRDGYDTVVGERGTGLSGGQRQCVAVARAMARNARIILLDEPTTGLDSATESVLLEALNRLSEGRTTIFVTHQLGAVRNADRITVLVHGHVVEEGRHQDLLRSKATYWKLQQPFSNRSVLGVG